MSGLDLTALDRYVGRYVHVERPRTSLEARAYGSGPTGGSGLVVEVRPVGTVRQTHQEETESLMGREIVFDYGVGLLVTEDSTIDIDDAEAIAGFLVVAARSGQAVADVLDRALELARHHGGLPAGTMLPDAWASTTLQRDLDAATEFVVGDSRGPWIEGQPPPSVEGVCCVGTGRGPSLPWNSLRRGARRRGPPTAV